MEWSFRGGGHGRKKQYISISTRDLKKVTLWLSVSFKGEKETCSVRLSTLQLLWRLCERLQKHSNTGIQNDVCGTICVSAAQTEEPVQSFLTASAKANSWCETAPLGDVVQAGKCPMVLLISASYCSLLVGVFYNLTPTRFVSWFLPGICWGFKALFPWGVNLFT